MFTKLATKVELQEIGYLKIPIDLDDEMATAKQWAKLDQFVIAGAARRQWRRIGPDK